MTEAFVDRVLHLLVSAGQPNVIRPATAIVRKLVISSPHFSGDIHNPKSPGPKIRRKSKGKEKEKVSEKGTPATTNSLVMSPVPGQEQPINYYGFERIFMRMCLVGDTLDGEEGTGGERFFRIIIKRLEGTGDLELVAQR
jgi:engulfment/cell motility protein 1